MPPQIGDDPIGIAPIGLPLDPPAAPAAAIVTSLWSDLSTVPAGAVSAFGLGPTPTGASLWDSETAPPPAVSGW